MQRKFDPNHVTTDSARPEEDLVEKMLRRPVSSQSSSPEQSEQDDLQIPAWD